MKFYTVPQIAELVQMSPCRVYEIIRLKLLPSVRFGRQVRVEVTAFEAWVEQGGQAYQHLGRGRAS